MLYYCIVPVRYTYLVEQEPRHLVIAQYLKKYPEMMEFFIKQVKMGHEVILDNGAYEFGKPMDTQEYFEMIQQLKPQIVVASDSWKNTQETIERVSKFEGIKQEYGFHFTTMYVPQGPTIKEYVRCMDVCGLDCGVDAIMGMSVGVWSDTLGVIRPFWVRNIGEGHKIHLLGLWSAMEILSIKGHSRVRSVDTSMPFKLAKNSEMFTPSSVNTEKMDFEMVLTGQQEELAEMNLERMRNFVEGI